MGSRRKMEGEIMMRYKEKTLYKNKNGKIISLEDKLFGGIKYLLFDSKGNLVKELKVPFRITDYL